MAKVRWQKHTFNFKQPSGTSRGVLTRKNSWFIIEENETYSFPAIGECSIIEGLSPDNLDSFEATLSEVCNWLNGDIPNQPDLNGYPAINFGLEMFLLDKANQGKKQLFDNSFSRGKQSMLINGLIWMGSKGFMKSQVESLVNRGFSCIKIKVGTLEFADEVGFIEEIRETYGDGLELRLDANGAFEDHTLQKLKTLSRYGIHSLEQPIKAGHWSKMAHITSHSPIPIALDEELIGIQARSEKIKLLETIKPSYIILKPSLLGGFKSCDEWIELADSYSIGWWITSALESNIGLNAISQYAFSKGVEMPQGLGTGSLYTNNFESPLCITNENINFDTHKSWILTPLKHE